VIPRGIDGGPATLPRLDDAAPAANARAEAAAFRDLVGSGLPQRRIAATSRLRQPYASKRLALLRSTSTQPK